MSHSFHSSNNVHSSPHQHRLVRPWHGGAGRVETSQPLARRAGGRAWACSSCWHRAAVRDLKKARAVKIPASKLTTDALAVATDPAVHIVCELIGNTDLAREVTLAALRQGKIVVSANKALLCGVRRGNFFHRAQAWRALFVRGVGRGRHPDHQGPARGPRRQPLPSSSTASSTAPAITSSPAWRQEGASYADDSRRCETALGYPPLRGRRVARRGGLGRRTQGRHSRLSLAHGVWVRTGRSQMIVEGIERITQADTYPHRRAARLRHQAARAVITRDFEQGRNFSCACIPLLLPRGGER